MTSLMPKLAVLLLSIVLLLPERSSAGYVLAVRTYTYRNRDHRESNGECCDPIFWSCNDCDNIFIFCLRDANNRDDNADNCPLGRDSFKDYRDTINFPQDDSSIHSFTSQEPWPGSVLLYVRIIDYDWYNRNDHVDNIYIPIRLNPGQSIPQRTFEGDYRRSRFELSIQLHCQPNFYGGDCLTNCVPTDDSTGHFRCSPQGERLCLNRWRDPANHCLTPICEECNPIGGRCTTSGQCTCLSGWTGTQCNNCSRTSPGCSTKGGYCKRPGECQCHKGYGGDNCEVYLFPCEHEPCQNGATCINDHGHGGYSCQCSSGYGGRNCTLPCDKADVDCTVPCNNLTNPCENGGTCQIQTSGEGISNCTCSKGFSGEYCEISVDDCTPNPCRNGGTCQHSTSTYVCICAEGYTGAHCEEDIDYCFTQPCQNNGTCVDLQGSNYTCSCPDGWAGHDCNEERDECREFQPCKNGANCTDLFNDYKCRCAPGYVGHDCEQEIKKCSSNPCKNGNCTDLFNGYTCQCFDEFTGVNCEMDLNSCRSSPCRNGGTCENKPDGFYVCTCPPGYTGFNCEIIERCLKLSSPCSNQGMCIDEQDDYHCICAPGFTGKDCSIALNSAVHQKQSGVAMEAIVGGVIGGVVLLVLLAFVIVAVYLLQKNRSSKYTVPATPAVVYSVNGDDDNPSYYVDVHIPGRNGQKSQRPLTDQLLGDDQATPLITGAQEDDQFGVEYHNFDNPLYAEGGAAAQTVAESEYHNFDNPLYAEGGAGAQTVAESPTYNRTSLPGPRGPTSNSRRSTVGNGRSSSSHVADISSTSAVPGPMEYAYVGVNQQQAVAAEGSNEASKSDNRLQQDDGIYELINTDD